jgi:hypothetical protein
MYFLILRQEWGWFSLSYFICNFKNLVSNYILSNDWMIVNNELQGMWKEAFVA